MQTTAILTSFSISIIVMGILLIKAKRLRTQIDVLQPIVKMVEYSKDIHYHYSLENGGYYVFLSRNIDHIFGVGTYEVHIANPSEIYRIVHPEDLPSFIRKEAGTANFDEPMKYRLRHKDGHYVWLEEHVTPIYKDGKVVSMYGIYRNISTEMKLKEALRYKLSHDSLTNVYNRTFFDELFVNYNENVDDQVGIVICDLDNLKQINDAYGHSVGDQYIKDAASLLKLFENESTYLMRIGGDEFVFFIIGRSETEIADFIKSIKKKLLQFNDVYPIEMSIGYAHVEHSIGQLQMIFELADRYMYKSKHARSDARGAIYAR
jgi:diguanylate cyclase (GGDEF)-like protein/PAS domain S-box-containing protein